jgi:hypothetical protein
MAFVLGSEECRVDLHGPQPVRRGKQPMVRLIDLWVATMLPWDVLDLTFDVLASGPGGATVLCGPLEGLRFSAGFVSLASGELWWDHGRKGTPHGLRAVAVVAHVRSEPSPEKLTPPALARPTVTLANLARLLPHAETAYPPVEWRVVPLT